MPVDPATAVQRYHSMFVLARFDISWTSKHSLASVKLRVYTNAYACVVGVLVTFVREIAFLGGPVEQLRSNYAASGSFNWCTFVRQ